MGDIVQMAVHAVVLLNLTVIIVIFGLVHGIFRVLGLMDFSQPLKYHRFPLWLEKVCTGIVLSIFPSEAYWHGRKPNSGERVLFILNHQITGKCLVDKASILRWCLLIYM